MKKTIILATLLVLSVATVSAQSTKDALKERKEMVKASKSELNKKATKAARKEAKQLKKAGWTTAPGALPIDRQLDRSYTMQYEFEPETGYPKYIMGEAMSIGENYDAAKSQAIELAKQNLAGQIQTEITALVEVSVSNKQLEAEEAASVTQSILASKNLIIQNIGRVITVMELYRTKDNKNKEVLVRIAYNSDMAKQVAKNAVRKDLEQRGDELHNKLDSLRGW